MNAGWRLLLLALAALAIAFVATRMLVPDVVPIGYQEEAQPSWAVLTAFALRAIELAAAWVAAMTLIVMGGMWTRRQWRRDLS